MLSLSLETQLDKAGKKYFNCANRISWCFKKKKTKKPVLWLCKWVTPGGIERGEECKGDEQCLCLFIVQTFEKISRKTHHPTWPRCYDGGKATGHQFRNWFQKCLTETQAGGIKTYGFPYDLMGTAFMPCSAQHTILQIQILRAVK